MAELWYFTRDGQAQDPVSKDELAQLAGSGLLKPTDLVWTEGMPQWVRASSAQGLFAEEALIAPGRQKAQRNRDRDLDARAELPRKRRQREDVDDEQPGFYDDEDFDRPKKRKRGLSNGAKAAIVAGSLVSVLLVVGLILALVLGNKGNTRSFSLALKQSENFKLPFKAGNKVEIWVKSTGKSDVDLYVYDANNRLVEFDDGPSSDCYVKFMVRKDQTFRVEVKNEARGDEVWRNGPNSGTLTFQEGPLLPGEMAPVEYTNRQPWFLNQANRFNPGLGRPPGFNPPGFNPPGFKPPAFQPPGFNPPGFNPPAFQPPGFKGPGIQPPGFNRPNQPFNPGFPNNPNRRP
jgi:hypothetical protein